MRLSDYQGEEALDLLADILEPAVQIMADPAIRDMYQSGGTRVGLVKVILKNHKKPIIEIMARIDGVPVDEYKVNVFTLPAKVIELLGDEDMLNFFKSQGQELMASVASGSAMESTEGEEN